jgi:hypothetical protein
MNPDEAEMEKVGSGGPSLATPMTGPRSYIRSVALSTTPSRLKGACRTRRHCASCRIPDRRENGPESVAGMLASPYMQFEHGYWRWGKPK